MTETSQPPAVGDGTKELLLFQIGPVQEFIAQARSTRDLWSGSYLLSWLVAHAIKAVLEKGGVSRSDVVLPAVAAPDPTDQGGAPLVVALLDREAEVDASQVLTPNLPNRCLFLVPKNRGKEYAEVARDAIRTELTAKSQSAGRPNKIGEAVFDWLKKEYNLSDSEKKSFDAQLWFFPHITYAWTPWKAGEKWTAAYARVGEQLAARRNVRDFAQWTGIAGRPKDSLSGKEEVIGDEPFWRRLRHQNENLSDEERSRLLFSAPGHAYGSVNLVKRLWMHVPGEARDSSYLSDALAFHKCRIWEELRIPSIPDIAKNNRDADKPNAPMGKFENGYVAVLAFDGDHMGTRVSACNHSPDELRAFSARLSRFALNHAGTIVRNHGGHLVYAGGDDVLAILPSTTAIACAEELRQKFEEVLGEGTTASCGIAVGHKNAPLQMLVNEARRMEHEAKETYGRNAVAIALYKRSGEIVEWGAHWGSAGLKLMPDITRFVGKGQLSGRFPYALAALLAPYDLEAKKMSIPKDDMKSIIRKEVAHVLSRQGEKMGDDERMALFEKICGKDKEETPDTSSENSSDEAPTNYLDECDGRLGTFINLFLVETFLNRARGEE